MNNLCTPPFDGVFRRQMDVFDDFAWYISPHLWTLTATDSGTATLGDSAYGLLTLAPSDGTVADNDEIYLATTKELFLIQTGKHIFAECKLQFTEANTDDANVMFGLMNAVAANAIVDDAGGPKSSFSGAVFYKVDGGTVWRVRSSIGTSYTDTALTTTAGGSAYQTLRIEIRPNYDGVAFVNYFIDGQPVLNPSAQTPTVLQHSLTYSSATEMQLFVGAKNGGANNENIVVDYIAGAQAR